MLLLLVGRVHLMVGDRMSASVPELCRLQQSGLACDRKYAIVGVIAWATYVKKAGKRCTLLRPREPNDFLVGAPIFPGQWGGEKCAKTDQRAPNPRRHYQALELATPG